MKKPQVSAKALKSGHEKLGKAKAPKVKAGKYKIQDKAKKK